MNAAEVKRRPLFWVPSKAVDFPTMWDLIHKHRTLCGVSDEFVAVLFFEESTFCNVIQNNGVGPGVGFGQTQIHDGDKVDFFREAMGRDSQRFAKRRDHKLPIITFQDVINNRDLSVKITWKYYEWLKTAKKKGYDGIMRAQAGGPNYYMIPKLQHGAEMLRKAITSDFTRESIAKALNYARGFKKPKPTTVGYTVYQDFWKFLIPDDYLRWGF
jgi:hypothetical protein